MPTPTSQKRPAFIPAPGVVQIQGVYSVFGQFCENVFHFRMTGGNTTPTVAQIDALMLAYENWERNTASPLRHSGCGYNITRGRDLSVQSGVIRERVPTPGFNGSLAGNAVPNNVTIAIGLRTGLGGRSFRGRSYWIGLGAGQIDGTNALQSGARASLPTALATLKSNMLTAGAEMVVVSYANNKFWRDVAVSTPVNDFSCDGILDSQRRRLPGRGK